MTPPAATDETATSAPTTAPLDEGGAEDPALSEQAAAPSASAAAPRSAAARRAAGEPVSEPQGDPGPTFPEQAQTPAPGPAPSSGVAIVADDMVISKEELAAFRAFRQTRAQEIMEAIDAAPVSIGTDLNPYTLVHLRGCPQPDRTETYPAQNGSQVFTVHRCIECGAHLAIPH